MYQSLNYTLFLKGEKTVTSSKLTAKHRGSLT